MSSYSFPPLRHAPAIVCPEEGARLQKQRDDGYRCPACSRWYPLERGVLRLLPSDDAFYEGAYQNHVAFVPRGNLPWQVWPLWLINSGYVWQVRRHVPEGSVVVELGCGGGVRYFGERYRMVGCDVSRSSLERLGDMYPTLLQADAAQRIPLADRSVDAVISSYFWEHVEPARKARLANECARVLRPGGKLLFLYDVETHNPLIAHYRRRSPRRYRELFLEGDGHLGYQRPAENVALFRSAGLNVLEHRGMEKTLLQSPSVYAKLAQLGGIGAPVWKRARALGERPLFYPYTALTRLVDTMVAPFLPQDWARVTLIVCEKPT